MANAAGTRGRIANVRHELEMLNKELISMAQHILNAKEPSGSGSSAHSSRGQPSSSVARGFVGSKAGSISNFVIADTEALPMTHRRHFTMCGDSSGASSLISPVKADRDAAAAMSVSPPPQAMKQVSPTVRSGPYFPEKTARRMFDAKSAKPAVVSELSFGGVGPSRDDMMWQKTTKGGVSRAYYMTHGDSDLGKPMHYSPPSPQDRRMSVTHAELASVVESSNEHRPRLSGDHVYTRRQNPSAAQRLYRIPDSPERGGTLSVDNSRSPSRVEDLGVRAANAVTRARHDRAMREWAVTKRR